MSYGWQCVRLSVVSRVVGRVIKEGRNSYRGFVICSTVSSLSSRQISKPVERCCSCTRHSKCSTAGLSARVCKCRNTGRQCTGCYCWGQCKNRGRLIPSPTTTRGLLGHFLRGADPPATNQCASPPFRMTASIFVLTGNIGGQSRGNGREGQSGRTQEPER